MIFNGIKLLLHPQNAWEKHLASQTSHSTNLIAAALTAATIPATAAVAGHLASAQLGYVAGATAIQRAAIGFVSITMGAAVMIPALALVLLRVGQNARVSMTPENASAAAMALVWSSWMCGIILGVPPLLNLRPEYGEFAWGIVAALAAYRILSRIIFGGVDVGRRWRAKFTVESMVAFVFLFVAISVAPAMLMRMLVGVTGQVLYGAPPDMEWPHPPPPAW